MVRIQVAGTKSASPVAVVLPARLAVEASIVAEVVAVLVILVSVERGSRVPGVTVGARTSVVVLVMVLFLLVPVERGSRIPGVTIGASTPVVVLVMVLLLFKVVIVIVIVIILIVVMAAIAVEVAGSSGGFEDVAI